MKPFFPPKSVKAALFGIIAVLLGIFAQQGSCNSPEDEVSDPDNWAMLTSCNDLPDGILHIDYNLEVTETIICDSPKGIEVAPETHVMVHSLSDILLRNVHFVVPRGSKLTLMAERGIYMQREETTLDIPFFQLAGELALFAYGWSPRYTEGDTEDLYWAIVPENEDEASLLCEADLRFTEKSLAVSSPTEVQRKTIEDLENRRKAKRKGYAQDMSSELKVRRFVEKRDAAAAAAIARMYESLDSDAPTESRQSSAMTTMSASSTEDLEIGAQNDGVLKHDKQEPKSDLHDQDERSAPKSSLRNDVSKGKEIKSDLNVGSDSAGNRVDLLLDQPNASRDMASEEVITTGGKPFNTLQAVSEGASIQESVSDILPHSEDASSDPMKVSMPVTLGRTTHDDVGEDKMNAQSAAFTRGFDSRSNRSQEESSQEVSLHDEFGSDDDFLSNDVSAFKDSSASNDDPPSDDGPPFGDESTEDTMFNPWTHPRSSPLRAGEYMRRPQVLAEQGGNAALSLEEDGSIMFRKMSSNTLSPKNVGKPAAAEAVMDKDGADVMLLADDRKVKKILRKREKLLQEKVDATSTPRKYRTGPWGWLQQRRDRAHEDAQEHIGKVEMSVTDRGCLTVTMDNQCVVSRSGKHKREWRNRFPWRRKRGEYELHTVDDGMEIRLKEGRVWGLKTSDSE